MMKGCGEGANRYRGFLRKIRSQAGVTTIEYAVMLVLVSLAVSTFGLQLGGSVDSVFSRMVLGLGDQDSGERNGSLSKKEREELNEVN